MYWVKLQVTPECEESVDCDLIEKWVNDIFKGCDIGQVIIHGVTTIGDGAKLKYVKQAQDFCNRFEDADTESKREDVLIEVTSADLAVIQALLEHTTL
jgi:hypothetical protein